MFCLAPRLNYIDIIVVFIFVDFVDFVLVRFLFDSILDLPPFP